MDFETDLEIVLAKWRTRLAELGAPAPTGYDTAFIDNVETALPKPLPHEIRRFYETFTPASWAIATKDSKEPALSYLDSKRWHQSLIYHPLDADVESLIEDAPPGPLEPSWLLLGGFGYGDFLIWAEEYKSCRRAILYVYLHGGAQAAGDPLVLGESLAVWLDRLLMCDGMEYVENTRALFPSRGTPGLPSEQRTRFLNHHLRLNPQERDDVESMKRLRKL